MTPVTTTPGRGISQAYFLGSQSAPAARNAAETEVISRAYDKHVPRTQEKNAGLNG